MMFIILIEALIMLLSKGTDGQKIVFDTLRNTSQCTQGLRSGIDNFTFTGTVENFIALAQSGWDIRIRIQISSVSPQQWDNVCEIYFGPGGYFCNQPPISDCYCDQVNTATDSVHFVVNRPTQEDYSGKIIRARWLNTKNGSALHSAKDVNLPAIYDVKKAKLNLMVNHEPPKQITATFEVHFLSNKSNTLELCCYESASPCYPRMSLNGQVFESQTGNCVNLTVFVPNFNYTANVTTSYAVCNKSDYITAGSGMITVKDESSTTTETTSEAPPNTADEYTTTTTGTTSTAKSTITSASKATVSTTPTTTTTLPFFRTTETRYDQADQNNLLTKFWPGLLITGLGFVLVLVCVVWDVVSSGTSEKKPTIENVTTLNEEEIYEKNQESEEVHEEIDSDTLKEMSETEV